MLHGVVEAQVYRFYGEGIMPPCRERRESRRTSEPNFPDITQLGEAMAQALQNVIRPPPPPRTLLETMYNLKLDRFMGNESHEGAERWLDHIEKTFQVMQSQGNLPANRWVETTTWFLGREPAAWWMNQTRYMSPEMAADWKVFKENFMKRFVPPEYIDRKKQEFTRLKQRNMSAHEYYRKFTDLSHYDTDTAGNQGEMLRCFKLGSKKKWRTFANALPCADYHEYFEILVRMEDSDNLPDSEDDEDKNEGQKKNDKVLLARGEVVEDFLVDPDFRDRGILVVLVVLALHGAAVVAPVTMVSVGEVLVLVLRVGRWDIGLLSAPRVSREHSRLICHLQHLFSRVLDRVVMASRVVVVPTTIRGMLLRMLPDLISIPRSLILRILEVIHLIPLCQLVDRSGIREASPVRGKLLLVMQDHPGSSQPGQGRNPQGRGNQGSRGRGGQQQAQGRVNHISLHEAQNHPDLIMGTLNVLGHFAKVLIDCGATHSVISHTFARMNLTLHL
ncbi:unnamed protein product [Malus baccata var. baccata]